jgi:hypothetical protein
MPTEAALRDQPGVDKLIEVKRQRRREDAEAAGDDAGRETLRPDRDEQPEQIEPGFLGKGRESPDHSLLFHAIIRLSFN